MCPIWACLSGPKLLFLHILSCLCIPCCIRIPDTDAEYAEAATTHSSDQSPPLPSRQTASGPISLELFGMEDQEDIPLTFPVQASITVLTPAHPSLNPPSDAVPPEAQSGSPSTQDATFTAFSDTGATVPEGLAGAELVAAVRQTKSAPISLELFGLEDQPDEPIELAAPAFTLPILSPDTQQLPLGNIAEGSQIARTAQPGFDGMLAESGSMNQPAGTAASHWMILTKLMQVNAYQGLCLHWASCQLLLAATYTRNFGVTDVGNLRV